MRGGWTIDFLLGQVTRPHDYIDLITWIQNRVRLELALTDNGYERIPVREQIQQLDGDKVRLRIPANLEACECKADELADDVL